jgi:CRISPR-associated protein Csb1
MSFIDKIKHAVAVKITETLVSVQQSVKMPSYAGERGKDEGKYPTWNGQNGTVNALLDTVQSQNNRIEPMFHAYPELVPSSKVVYPSETISLTEVPNRAGDPAIRYHFANELEELAAGNAEPLAKRNPTALIFGLWDSRATRVRVPRAVEATVVVRGAVKQPIAASLSTPFTDDERADIAEKLAEIKMKPSEVGVDQVPVFNQLGALDVTGATIERTVTLSVSALDSFKSNQRLYDYILGLALVAALSPIKFNLRSGTVLNRVARKIELYNDLQPAETVDVNFEEVLAFARQSAKAFGIGKPETLTVEVEKIIENAKQKSGEKKEKKRKRTAVAA